MKVKKIFVVLCAALVMLALMVSASAAESGSTIIDLGDGFYIVRTVTPHAVTRSGNMVYGKVTDNVYYQTTQIGSATLAAAFDISGSSAVAQSAVLQGTGMNGWTFTNGGTKCSGNTATGTAIFQSGSTTKRLPMSISCAPDGALS